MAIATILCVQLLEEAWADLAPVMAGTVEGSEATMAEVMEEASDIMIITAEDSNAEIALVIMEDMGMVITDKLYSVIVILFTYF